MAITRHKAALVAQPTVAKALGSARVAESAAVQHAELEMETERKVLAFFGAYLALEAKPSAEQVKMLAGAIGCDYEVVRAVLASAASDINTPEYRKDAPEVLEVKVSNQPGINAPGALDSFDSEDINPNGRTNMDDLESPLTDEGRKVVNQDGGVPPKGSRYNPVDPGGVYPAVQPNLASLSKSTAGLQGFLQPLDDPFTGADSAAESDTDSETDPGLDYEVSSLSDGLPDTRSRTGVDDGALVDEELDEQERDDLINDGEPSFTRSTQAPNSDNRHLNDDGLF